MPVRKGQPVEVTLGPGVAPTGATVSYVAPVADAATRTVRVRAILNNGHGRFRPGLFVDGSIQVVEADDALLVPQAAIQLVDDHPCVFVRSGDEFERRDVTLGVNDGRQVEIIDGLSHGELVVTENAFHLKAELTKSADSGCAGHGHAH